MSELFNNVDPEDIDDVIAEISASLNIEFQDKQLSDAKTFDEFCRLVHLKVNGVAAVDCTTQQAFYKLRKEIGKVLIGGH